MSVVTDSGIRRIGNSASEVRSVVYHEYLWQAVHEAALAAARRCNLKTSPDSVMYSRKMMRFSLLLVAALLGASGCANVRQFLARPADTGVQPGAADPLARIEGGADNAFGLAPLVADPPDAEPEAVASDSAGIARLIQLATVWHTVSLHHPWVATRGVPWDSALIIAAPRVRSATDEPSLALAYHKLFSLLRDPLSRVEPATVAVPAPVPVTAENRSDSVVIIRIAPSATLDANDSALVAQIVSQVSARILLDLRGAPVPDPLAQSVRLDAFLSRTGVTNRLVSGNVSAPVERTRRVGVWPASTVGAQYSAVFRDGWDQPASRIISGQARVAPRIVIIADSGTVMPDVLIALQSNVSAFLIADGPLRDAVPVTRVRIPLTENLVVTVRTGELIQSDGSVDVRPDLTIASGTRAAGDSALQVGVAMLRSAARWSFAPRAVPLIRTPAVTPVFFDTASYPYMGARLLGGFRLWSAMRARHAHRDLYDDDIDAVFERVIPKLESAQTAPAYAKAVAELAATLNDVEATVQGASFASAVGDAAVPFRVRSAEGRVFITDVLQNDVTTALGLVRGTEILSMDGYPMVSWLYEHRSVAPSSNDWSRTNALMNQMSRGAAGEAMVKVRDLNGKDRTVQVPRTTAFRAALPVLQRPGNAPVFKLNDAIAYIDVEQLNISTAEAAAAMMMSARGVVLDLRGHLSIADSLVLKPLATRPHALIGRVIQRSLPAPCFASLRNAAVECGDARESRSWWWPHDTLAAANGARPKIVALIDERTQGAMERLALTLDQVAPVTFVGSPSAGSVSFVTPLSLPGGLTVGIATQEIRSATDGQVQRVGLTPLVDYRPTARSLKAGEDDVLSRAQQWLQQQLDPPTRRRR